MKPDGTVEYLNIIPTTTAMDDNQMLAVVKTCIAESKAGSPQSLGELIIQAGLLKNMANGAKEQSEKLKAAYMTQNYHADRIMQMIADEMEEEGIAILSANHQIVRLKEAGGRGQVIVTGEVPDDYMRVNQTKEPNKKLIGDAIERGEVIDWAFIAPKKKVLSVDPC